MIIHVLLVKIIVKKNLKKFDFLLTKDISLTMLHQIKRNLNKVSLDPDSPELVIDSIISSLGFARFKNETHVHTLIKI